MTSYRTLSRAGLGGADDEQYGATGHPAELRPYLDDDVGDDRLREQPGGLDSERLLQRVEAALPQLIDC